MRIQLSLITHADYFRINPGVIYIRDSLTNNVIDSFTFAGAAYDSDSLDVLTAVLNYQYGRAVRRHPAKGHNCVYAAIDANHGECSICDKHMDLKHV